MDNDKRKSVLNKLLTYSGGKYSKDTLEYEPFTWESKDESPYKKSDKIKMTANYSKVMRALQLAIVNELNKRYISNDDTADLFSILVSNALQSKQIYVDIHVKRKSNKDVVITFKLEDMKNAKYKFYNAGSTWNAWDEHGSIGFGIKK